MKGYKAFEKGLVCRGKQYAENTVFEEDAAEVCRSGMHFCKNPFDVLDYYDLVNCDGSFNDFAEVEALAEAKTDDDKKFCTTKLKVGAKLGFKGFVEACVEFVLEQTKTGGKKTKLNDNGGDDAQIGSSGNSAKIGSSGNDAKIGSSGNYAKIESTGEDAVICCAGSGSKVKAKKGSWITLSEWEFSEEKARYIPKCVKTEYVDGERIKADTWYRLVDGKFEEQE
jgi:hypothetical protein